MKDRMNKLTKRQQIRLVIKFIIHHYIVPAAKILFGLNFIFIFIFCLAGSVTLCFIVFITFCSWVMNCLAYEQIVDFYPMLKDTFWHMK